MNIVLFEEDEIGKRFARDDDRIRHVIEILGRKAGVSFDAGVINGKCGKAILTRVDEEFVELEFDLNREEPPLPPIDLIVGLSRPQTNRKILQEATSVGVRKLLFVATERGEPSYAQSKLWTTGEWRRHVLSGAAQAFTSRIPLVTFDVTLEEAIVQLDDNCRKIALDNYEAKQHIADLSIEEGSVILAVGSERGWTGTERDLLRKAHFELAHLGRRPLRTETAVLAGLAILNHRF